MQQNNSPSGEVYTETPRFGGKPALQDGRRTVMLGRRWPAGCLENARHAEARVEYNYTFCRRKQAGSLDIGWVCLSLCLSRSLLDGEYPWRPLRVSGVCEIRHQRLEICSWLLAGAAYDNDSRLHMAQSRRLAFGRARTSIQAPVFRNTLGQSITMCWMRAGNSMVGILPDLLPCQRQANLKRW